MNNLRDIDRETYGYKRTSAKETSMPRQPKNLPLAHSSNQAGIRQTGIMSLGKSGAVTGKIAPPPVYRPQPAVSPAMQSKMAPGTRAAQGLGAPPVYRPQPAPGTMQPKSAQSARPPVGAHPGMMATSRLAASTNISPKDAPVVQAKGNKCIVCGHKHGSSTCTVATGWDSKGKANAWCGCKSHSSHWGKGSKFNPGSGKRARQIAAATGQTV